MIYLIKANLILALLCLLFQVLMYRDTFFGVRRMMLWGIYLTAFLLPLWDVQGWLAADTATHDVAEAYAVYVLPTLHITAQRVAGMGVTQSDPGCGMWFVGTMALWVFIYLIPVLWLTTKLIGQIAYIIYLRCTCSPIREKIFYFPRPCSPFSFGPWIFIHTDNLDEQTLREVLIHEQTHVQGWHTLDILFSQLVCILFWWNPAAWVMRREVRLNLEFLADAAVIGSQTDKREYQYRLLGFTTLKNVATITNNFNVLPLKRRITMMNSRKTPRTGMLKYILFVPVAAALLFASNIDTLARTLEENVKKPLITTEEPILAEPQTTKSTPDDKIYEKVEVLPKYPGDEPALYQYLAMNVKYPAAAQEYGVQARVMVTFVVEKDGTLTDVKAIAARDLKTGQELSEVVVTAIRSDMTEEEVKQAELQKHQAEGVKALKAESVRVVKAMSERWKPGLQGGKPVRTRFTLPLVFRLQ